MWLILILLISFIAIFGVGALFGAPFVPTRKIWIRDALELAKINKNDVVLDLGSGNGEVLKMAINSGAKQAIGYEINPILVAWSRMRFSRNSKISVKNKNFLTHDLPENVTVIYLFQIKKVVEKIPEKIRADRKRFNSRRIRVICFGFELDGETIVDSKKGMLMYEF